MSQKQKTKKGARSEAGDFPQEESPVSGERTEQINETGSVIVSGNGATIHCLTIIGQIEGHYVLPPQNKITKYEHVIPQLIAVEEDDNIDGLLLILNTVGGDVEAGLAIAELISGMKKPTVSLVLGGGHSIGIPLAVAAKKSFIAKSASMTVHPVRSSGVMVAVSQTFDYYRKMQNRITEFVAANSKITKERYLQLVMNTEELVMDIGTILEGEEAVEEGLIDSVGTISDAISDLASQIKKRRRQTKNTKK